MTEEEILKDILYNETVNEKEEDYFWKTIDQGHQPFWASEPNSLYKNLAGARCRDVTRIFLWAVHKILPNILVTAQ